MGGGVIRIVGTGGIVGSLLVTVLGSRLGTRFAVLGSGLWNTEKTKLRRDTVECHPNHHVEQGDQARNEKEMRIDMMECCLQQGDRLIYLRE